MDAYIGAGSNLGDRVGNLYSGLVSLRREGVPLADVSSLWETEPVDAPGSPPFLNLVVKVETEWDPVRLLACLLRVEAHSGRVRRGWNAPRCLDLDLLLQGSHRCSTRTLELPHPRMWERRFVLAPLAELAPDLRDPLSGRTVAEQLRRLPESPWVRRIGVLPALPASSYNPDPGYT